MSTAGNSYDAWKDSLLQAEAAGDEEWSEECWQGTPISLGSIVEMKGVCAGLLIGVGLMVAGFGLLLPNTKHLTWGKRTVGTVVGHKDYINRRSNTLVTPVVRYSAPGGVYDFVGALSVARSLYPPGKEVSVLYLPNNPSNAVIADFVQIFMIPAIVGGLGFICLSGTAGFMFLVIRCELPPDKVTAYRAAPMNAPPAPSALQPKQSAV